MSVEAGKEGLPYNPEEYTLEEVLKPQHSALIVVDMQNDFLDKDGYFAKTGKDISGMQATIPHIQKLIDVAHTSNVPVIFTKGSEDVLFRTGPGFRRAIKWEEKDGNGSVNSERGTVGWEFHPDLQPGEGDIVLEKHKWSSFDGKDKDGKSLDEILKEKGIKTLVVTGVVTETCVYATVQEAYNKDYFVVVPKNSVGSDIPEQHKTVLEHMDPFLGDVVDESVIKENWVPLKSADAQSSPEPAL